MTRVLITLCLALAMVHGNVARADAACATHHAEATEGHEGMQHGSQSPSDDQSCDEPAMTDCCQAVLSCAPVLDLGEAWAAASPEPLAHAAIAAAVAKRPLSRSTAPEPPPPKA